MAMYKLDNGKQYCDCLDSYSKENKDRHLKYMTEYDKKLHTTGTKEVSFKEFAKDFPNILVVKPT